jgi:hypothetical protein
MATLFPGRDIPHQDVSEMYGKGATHVILKKSK